MPNEFELTIPTLTVYESDAEKIARLERENAQLQIALVVEKRTRIDSDNKVEELQNIIGRSETKKKAPKSREISLEYSEFKTDGKRKARAAQSIRSYEDFDAIQKYFLDKGDIRDWMLWVIGVSLGLRISDLLSLKYCNMMNPNKTFRERIVVIEKKTHKANNCLMTDSVKFALKTYLDSIKWKFSLDDYIFKSNKTKGRMTEEYGWMILSNAGKALGLPFVMGSHTMRKSFANIAACVDKSSVDMNSITKVQGLLNHSDQKVTMTYLGTYKDMYDRARIAVSNFVLGKTDVHEIRAGGNYTIDDIANLLEKVLDQQVDE